MTNIKTPREILVDAKISVDELIEDTEAVLEKLIKETMIYTVRFFENKVDLACLMDMLENNTLHN